MFVPEIGKLYYGRVVRLMTFGAFVELAPGKDGLLKDYDVEALYEGARALGIARWRCPFEPWQGREAVRIDYVTAKATWLIHSLFIREEREVLPSRPKTCRKTVIVSSGREKS